MQTAYAVAIIDLRTNQARYGIFGDWPLTRGPNAAEIHSLIAQAQAPSFEGAWRALILDHDVAKLVQMGLVPADPRAGMPRVLHTQ